MIYKFDQFNEKYNIKSRAQVLGMSKEMALKTYAPWYDWNDCKTKMYRAVKGKTTKPNQVKIIDPSKFHRRALGKPPFYNLIISDWEGYPDRSESVICSTKKTKLDTFGSLVYRVIPMEENSKVAFAPTTDLWASFNNYASYQAREYNLNLRMNPSDFVNDIAGYFFPEKGKKLQGITLDQFRERVKSKEKSDLTIKSWGGKTLNFFANKRDHKIGSPTYDQVFNLKDQFYKDFDSIWDFLVDAYDPELNGFKLLDYNNETSPDDYEFHGLECWTDVPCLMIFEDFA